MFYNFYDKFFLIGILVQDNFYSNYHYVSHIINTSITLIRLVPLRTIVLTIEKAGSIYFRSKEEQFFITRVSTL